MSLTAPILFLSPSSFPSQDGGLYYAIQNGALVQDWYSTCRQDRMDVASRGAAAEKALSSIPSKNRVPSTSKGGAEVVFPYPKSSRPSRVTVCNYSGKDYWWSRSKIGASSGDEMVRIPPVTVETGCASVPVKEACSDKTCWER